MQNSFILDQLQVNNHVYMFKASVRNPFPDLALIGRNNATVFTGFCGRHDNDLFREIDFSSATDFDKDSPRQACLYFLRATAHEYWKKLNSIHNLQEVLNGQVAGFDFPTNKAGFLQFLRPFIEGHKLGLEDLRKQFESFLYQVKINKFHLTVLKTHVIDAPCRFAVSAAFTPDFDFKGGVLFERAGRGVESRWPGFFMHVLPMSGKTILQFGAHKTDRDLFSKFSGSIETGSIEPLQKSISRVALAHSENIVISPARVDLMSQSERTHACRYFTETIIQENNPEGVPNLF